MIDIEHVGQYLHALVDPEVPSPVLCGSGPAPSVISADNPADFVSRLINPVPDSVQYKLLESAKQGNEEGVKQAIQLGANIHTVRDENGMTPLHLAAWNGHTKVVSMLLDKGASAQATSKHGSTPVHAACDRGHTEIARLLLQKGAFVNAKNVGGMTPLHHAAWNDYAMTANMLLEMGADMAVKDSSGRTPLHLASQQGSITVACMLLDGGANPSPRDVEGRTPLYVAKDKSMATCLRKKMNLTSFRKIDPNDGASMTSGDASVMSAPKGTHSSVIKSLLQRNKEQKYELEGQHEKYKAVETLEQLVNKLGKRDNAQKVEITNLERGMIKATEEHKEAMAKVQAVIDVHLQSGFHTTVRGPMMAAIQAREKREKEHVAEIERLKAKLPELMERDLELKQKLAIFGHLVES